MWVCDLNRKQFLDALQAETILAEPAAARDVGDGLAAGAVRLIWKERPRSGILPAVLVVSEKARRDFFAWSNTYLAGWCPVSSLFRVVGERDLQPALEMEPKREIVWQQRNAVLGLILGEAVTRMVAGDDGAGATTPSFPACIGTCSFTMGRAMFLDWPDLRAVAKRWRVSQALGRGTSTECGQEDVAEPWLVLAEVGGLGRGVGGVDGRVFEAVVRVCRSLQKDGEVDGRALRALTRDWPGLELAFASMGDARERRVQALDSAVRQVGERRGGGMQLAAIALGLLASRIAPGSLDHIALIRPHARTLKGLLLWYGLFSGMDHAARLVDRYGSLGRRLLREMVMDEPIFASPSCDVALDELEVMSALDSSLRSVQRICRELLTIEILPRVCTVARATTEVRTAGEAQRDLFEHNARQLESDIRDWNRVTDRLRKRVRRLGGR